MRSPSLSSRLNQEHNERVNGDQGQTGHPGKISGQQQIRLSGLASTSIPAKINTITTKRLGLPKEKQLSKQPILNSTNTNQKRSLICGTWNIRRGLINKELEIKLILEKDEIDVPNRN